MLSAFGLYTHIRANEIRSRVLLAGLFGLVLVATYAGALMARGLGGGGITGNASLAAHLRAAAADLLWLGPLALGATVLWLFVAYHWHQRMIDRAVGARPVSRADAPELYRLLEALCISRGLRVPALHIADDPALNAFASGLNPDQYAVTVTTGLIGALSAREMEAVLAHELTHIRNDDVRTMVIAVIIAGVFGFAADLILRGNGFATRDGDRRGSLPAFLVGAALFALAWISARLIHFSLSRTREFIADAGAAELTKDPDAMIAALLKISKRSEMSRAPAAVMELCVDNPRAGIWNPFATHPSIEDRIAALVRYAGGRPPPPA